MKIALVCPYDLGRPGGVQNHIVDLARFLIGQGEEAVVIGPDSQEVSADLGVPCQMFGKSKSVLFNKTQMDVTLAQGSELRRLEAFFSEQRFDLVHFHTLWDPFLPFQIFRRTADAARVATFHDTPPDTLVGDLTRFVFGLASRYLSKHLDGLIAVSEAPAAHLKPIPGAMLRVIPPSTNLLRRDGRGLRTEKNTDGPFKILFLGRMDPRKGVETLIRAARLLEDRQIPVEWIIAGDGSTKAPLQTLTKQLGLQTVSFLGAVDDATKWSLISSCDLFCAPSLYGESYGIVLLEAMAAGMPVVAAANAGYRSVLREQEVDCLFQPGNAEALAEKVSRLRADPARLRDLSAWGRGLAADGDISVQGLKIHAFYREAIKRKHASGLVHSKE